MIDDIGTDLYSIIGVPRNASQEDIKRSYRRKARECHPDVNADDPEGDRKFKELTFAYEVLSDERKRREYDRWGMDAFRRGGSGFEGFGDFTDFSDLIDMFFGEAFGRPFSRSRTRSRRGRDLSLRIELELEDALNGVEKEVSASVLSVCETCNGTGTESGTAPTRCSYCGGVGQVRSSQRTLFGTFMSTEVCPRCGGSGEVIESPCPDCNGEGRVNRNQKIKISLPPGIEEGDRIRLRGQGEAGLRGAGPGDLYVMISFKPHRYFGREGRDILCGVVVDMEEAALGTDIEIPHFEEPVTVKVPAGTQPGRMIKVKGKGLPRRGGGKRGDLIAEVVVVVPKRLRGEEKRQLQKYADVHKSGLDGSRILDRADRAMP